MLLADWPDSILSPAITASREEMRKDVAEMLERVSKKGSLDNPVANTEMFKEKQEVDEMRALVESFSLSTSTHMLNKEGKSKDTITGRKVAKKALGECHVCRKSGNEIKLKRCTACYQVAYCGSVCQRNDWAQHKVDCRKIQAK